jgi:histidinol-phosphate aminotransferase
VVFLDNPCNPTGRYLDQTTMADFLQRVPDSTLVAVDEAYAEYVESPTFKSCIGLVNQHPNLVVVRTLSKAYGLAGLRLGYGVSNPELIEQLERARPPFNINALTAELARMAVEDSAFLDACRTHNAAERTRLQNHPAIAPYCVAASEGNFFFLKVPAGSDVVGRLKERNVHVRAFPEYPDHVRVTIGTVEENEAFIEAFSEAIAAHTAA